MKRTITVTEQEWNAIYNALLEAESKRVGEDYPTPAEEKVLAGIQAALKAVSPKCFECDAEHCAYNPDGICKFALVYGREPVLHDDGCNDFCYKED